MTPKEKANELVFKYIDTIPFLDYDVFAASKQCALICVDEILEIKSVYHDIDLYDYWEEVKRQINQLK